MKEMMTNKEILFSSHFSQHNETINKYYFLFVYLKCMGHMID